MTQAQSCNCIVCAKEFDPDELQSVALSKINVTRFKICESCLKHSDPAEDYRQAREIISSYLWFAEARGLFKEASDILDELGKEKSPMGQTVNIGGRTYPKVEMAMPEYVEWGHHPDIEEISKIDFSDVPHSKFVLDFNGDYFLVRTKDGKVMGVEEL